jgi:dextranase
LIFLSLWTFAAAPILLGDTLEMNTDKARYLPGETVTLTVAHVPEGKVIVCYKHLSKEIGTHSLTSRSWNWKPPADDFKGYMAEAADESGTILGTVGIDVSSDWKKFPRYGFLSKYGAEQKAEQVIAHLNRYHITGLQFYDWLYQHHKPLAGTPESPMNHWTDIFRRPACRTTTDEYLAAARKYGMVSMMYNLCFGVWKNADQDGVAETWYLFHDAKHQDKDRHKLTYGLSDIFLVNPANPDWQKYLAKQNEDVYQVYGFDGYHIDQLGERGKLYDYAGNKVNLPGGYLSFINAMKKAAPAKKLVMNAVSEFGQEKIAQGEVDFLYNEVWGGNYNDYIRIIKHNLSLNVHRPATVFASYINYKYAQTGARTFNTPGVLFADAVIFAHGGAHLELGEHLLCSEYFPNTNLTMSQELEQSLHHYYNFSVGYQNLLRDGGEFNNIADDIDLASVRGKIKIANQCQLNSVLVSGKLVGRRQVIHLINFSTAASLDARDADGKQTEPVEITGIELHWKTNQTVKEIWFASPDSYSGASAAIPFRQEGNDVKLTVPPLKYWNMLVAEFL